MGVRCPSFFQQTLGSNFTMDDMDAIWRNPVFFFLFFQSRALHQGGCFLFLSLQASLGCFFFYFLFHIHTEPNHGTNGRHHRGQSKLIPNIGAKYSIRSQTLGAFSLSLLSLSAQGMWHGAAHFIFRNPQRREGGTNMANGWKGARGCEASKGQLNTTSSPDKRGFC